MLKNKFKQFMKEEDGGLVEYLILIAIAAVAAALLFPTLRKNLVTWFNAMVSNVNDGIGGKTVNSNPNAGSGEQITW